MIRDLHGRLCYALGEYKKALVFLTPGTRNRVIVLTRLHLPLMLWSVKTYTRLNDFPKAICYANESKGIQEINALFVLKNATGALAEIYTGTKNYKKAYSIICCTKS